MRVQRIIYPSVRPSVGPNSIFWSPSAGEMKLGFFLICPAVTHFVYNGGGKLF